MEKEVNTVQEKVKYDEEMKGVFAKYEKHLKRKKKKIKKLKLVNKQLQEENEALRKKLKKKEKKIHALKKSMQMERYYSGHNPFAPYDSYSAAKKLGQAKKKKGNAIFYPNYSRKHDREFLESNIVDGEYREV